MESQLTAFSTSQTLLLASFFGILVQFGFTKCQIHIHFFMTSIIKRTQNCIHDDVHEVLGKDFFLTTQQVSFSNSFYLKLPALLTAAAVIIVIQVMSHVPPDIDAQLQAANTVQSVRILAQANDDRRLGRAERLRAEAEAKRAITHSAATDTGSVLSHSGSLHSSSGAVAHSSTRSDNKFGVYLSASSVGREKFFNDTVASLKSVSGSALVFDVKGGVVMFHSAAPMANDIGLVNPQYDLPVIIKKLHDNGIYVIGRFVAIKDYGLTSKLPDTRMKDPAGKYVLSETWVDPSNDDAIQYNMEVLCELAAAGIDEVNLDYIRFSTAQVGALRVYSGKEKADRVEKFIKASRETINRCGPNTKLGLSTYAILGWNYDVNVETLGQDVVRFAPLVDVISPMAYPATFTSPEYYIPGKNAGTRMYSLVYRTLTGYAKILGEEHAKKIRPWIQGYSVVSKDVLDQVQAVYDAGFCGYTLWNAGNNYGQSFAAMKKDAQRPLRCFDQSIVAEKL